MEHRSEKWGHRTLSEYLRALHVATCLRESHGGPEEKPKPSQRIADAGIPRLFLSTPRGQVLHGDSLGLLHKTLQEKSVDLIMTSPPFGLVRKKEYGNEDADAYLEWFRPFAEGFRRVLKDSGSLVIDIGGSWKKGLPTRSLYHFELLVMLCREYGFHLAQEFYWWNPAKLPTPAEWVNVRRIRVKDAVNCIWWLSPTPWPKASNRRVLQPYSESMRLLLKNGYTPKLRPSGHDISDKFQRDNKGAIPPNLLALPNTESNDAYQRYCQQKNLPRHPARFPSGIPEHFIRMLTDPEDLVVDPFAGSCVTGAVSERLRRRWICCEIDAKYLEGARIRFESRAKRTGRSFGDSTAGNGRGQVKPYEIFPPGVMPVDGETTPLSMDGGKTRTLATVPPTKARSPRGLRRALSPRLPME
jgi:site-specific DNA-methyltransferase (cytosine-N4-specific)